MEMVSVPPSTASPALLSFNLSSEETGALLGAAPVFSGDVWGFLVPHPLMVPAKTAVASKSEANFLIEILILAISFTPFFFSCLVLMSVFPVQGFVLAADRRPNILHKYGFVVANSGNRVEFPPETG
ncbi:MAG: hypothetical protein MR648_03210 [Clostridiales bacterium]|nr:hypothetical protein [Clostridiales bacterium]MDY4181267.1 hypothetical protein [Pseudoflavonifractor sp.]